MSFTGRIQHAFTEAHLSEAIQPALQPWRNTMTLQKDGHYMSNREGLINAAVCWASPFILAKGLVVSARRFADDFIHSPGVH